MHTAVAPQESVGLFLREISQTPLLTREGEQSLARSLELAAYVHTVRAELSHPGQPRPNDLDVRAACYRRSLSLRQLAARHDLSIDDAARSVVEISILGQLLPESWYAERVDAFTVIGTVLILLGNLLNLKRSTLPSATVGRA